MCLHNLHRSYVVSTRFLIKHSDFKFFSYPECNYKLLNEFGHRSVGLDEHMNNKVSSETGVISHVKNSPIFDNAKRMPRKNSGIFKTSANFYENMKITPSCNTLSRITTNRTAVTIILLHILI
jgi:hypothetical protein